MVTLTPAAAAKIKEIVKQDGHYAILRLGVQGGGCSGFSYCMKLEDDWPDQHMDKTFDFDGLKVVVDVISLMYLKGVTIDYVETLGDCGFKFDNPNVKSTCGCGQSFSV